MPKYTTRKRQKRASWGSLQYDPKTRTARIRYWAEGSDGYRRRSKTLRNVTRKQAEEERAKLLIEHGEDAPCPTVAQVWERWVLPDYERKYENGQISQNTLRQYKSAWNAHVAPRWANVPCDEVRALAVQQWLLDGKTYAQAVTGRNILTAILDCAMRYEVITSNVAKGRYSMPSKGSGKDKGIWTLTQLGEVWRLVHGSFIEGAFLLSAFGSCRVGESLAPLAEDVEGRIVDGIQLAVVNIDKQVPNRGKELVMSTKTGDSTRHVVIAGRAAVRLLELADKAEGGFVSGNGVGSFLSQYTLAREWKKLVTGELYHPYRNLRNSWQTYMRWELGVPPWMTGPMMGHKGEGITAQYYDRPQVDVFCETMAKVYAEHPYDAAWTWLD